MPQYSYTVAVLTFLLVTRNCLHISNVHLFMGSVYPFDKSCPFFYSSLLFG